MLKDIPYSELKKNEKAYQIVLMRDQQSKTYTQIAKELDISLDGVRQIYDRLKRKQIQLYINHIAFALGHENTDIIKSWYYEVNEWYQDWQYISGYFEKEYEEILREYRAGEPGMPEEFIEKIPPLQSGTSSELIATVVYMREMSNMGFARIGKNLNMTAEKARHTYEMFYNNLALALFGIYKMHSVSKAEKDELWKRCFYRCRSAKKRCIMLLQECNNKGFLL